MRVDSGDIVVDAHDVRFLSFYPGVSILLGSLVFLFHKSGMGRASLPDLMTGLGVGAARGRGEIYIYKMFRTGRPESQMRNIVPLLFRSTRPCVSLLFSIIALFYENFITII